MNYIERSEQILANYKDLQNSIKNIENRIMKLKFSGIPREISASYMDDICVKSSPKHDETINILCELKELVDKRIETLDAMEEIDQILENISIRKKCENYGSVLRMLYIEELTVEDTAEKLGYSSRQSIYDIKKPAIRKFAINWFGVSALKVI